MEGYVDLIASLEFDALAGLPLAGLPIGTALAYRLGVPLGYPRPPKAHGTGQQIEGGVKEGSHLLLIDDLATRGVSAREALPVLRSRYEVSQLAVLIDRESGAKARLAQDGVVLHSLFRLGDLLHYWLLQGDISSEQYQRVRDFMSRSGG